MLRKRAEPKKPAKRPKAAVRGEKIRPSVYLDRDQYDRLTRACSQRGLSANLAILEAVEAWLKKQGFPPES